MQNQPITRAEAQRTAVKRSVRTVLVLGGYGFVGRYTVKALQRRAIHILIGTRGLNRSVEESTERRVCLHEAVTADRWSETVKNVDVVINTVGILRERSGESFDAVHHLAVGALAVACQRHGIPLIHMSALGIDSAVNNECTKSKLLGEEAIIASRCTGAIVRTSVVDAPDGYGSGWFHRLANWPVWLIPVGADKLLSPIDAVDAGEALAALALDKQVAPLESLEIGCGENFTLSTYLSKLRRPEQCYLAKPLFTVKIPQALARLSARLFDLLHITPYSIGHHELLEHDNVPVHNRLPELLGRMPTPIGSPLKRNDKPVITRSHSLKGAENRNSGALAFFYADVKYGVRKSRQSDN